MENPKPQSDVGQPQEELREEKLSDVKDLQSPSVAANNGENAWQVSASQIIAMMADKQGKDEKSPMSQQKHGPSQFNKAVSNADQHPDPEKWSGIATVGLWFGLAVGLGALVALIFVSARDVQAGILIFSSVALIISLALIVGSMRSFPSSGLGLRSIFNGKGGGELHLASTETLTDMKLVEKVLDTDEDARLVARKDGVVVYANQRYIKLAEEAGVQGFSGLPPRIERLFAQQGTEAMKVFRLCRAARSGQVAHEDIYQVIAMATGNERRRYKVGVHPIEGDDNHITWSLRALPIDEEEHDYLAASYADYIRPVFALEKSGQINWANAAMREKLGVEKGALHHIDDVVLGETSELIASMWRADKIPHTAKVRRQHRSPLDGVFVAFDRGGVGEGFVCVELTLEEEVLEPEETSLSGEITEAPFGFAIVQGEFGKDAHIVEANRAFTEVFGGNTRKAVFAKHFPAETVEELARETKRKAASNTTSQPVETRVGDGLSARTYALYAKPVSRRRGGYGPKRTLIFSVDITERKNMELDYGQDQKLKAIGNLAGEVAHDFNNFLQTILGNCELLLMNHPVGDPSYDQLVVIRENSQRLANLTKQLLAFSRKQTMQRKVSSITDILRDFTKFLDRAVGDKVKLELVNGRGLKPVRVDQNQLEASIMNLAVNARDAMGAHGGTLTIRTQYVSEKEIISAELAGLSQQDHILIEISDTGPGVPSDIADQIFDPFFTTKEVGKGTGLGLSTVHGVIGQMGGGIYLDSEEGKGATFRIYLPAFDSVEPENAQTIDDVEDVDTPDLTGAGRILVVEDEDSVRNFVVIALKGRGYEVTEACDGVDAMDVLDEHGADQFDLIISDVMMTEMDGPVFVQEAQEKYQIRPRVIFMSGYAEAAMRDQIDQINNSGYLQKPFQAEALAAAVKDVIGMPAKK